MNNEFEKTMKDWDEKLNPKYKIIHNNNHYELEAEINKYIKDDYKPIGGIAIKYSRDSSYHNTVEYYYQAIIKIK